MYICLQSILLMSKYEQVNVAKTKLPPYTQMETCAVTHIYSDKGHFVQII